MISHGVQEISINVHYLSDQIKSFINRKKFKVKITISNEEGISEIRIFGTPNITQNSQVQYVYTVTTNANPAGCTPVATATGTLKVAPLETVTYDSLVLAA